MPSFLRRCPVAVPKISQRHLSRRNFDRGHSLTSLYPPQAALRSLPAHRRCHRRGAEAHRRGDRGYHQGYVRFSPERKNLSLRASAHTGAAIRDCKKRRRKPSLFLRCPYRCLSYLLRLPCGASGTPPPTEFYRWSFRRGRCPHRPALGSPLGRGGRAQRGRRGSER